VLSYLVALAATSGLLSLTAQPVLAANALPNLTWSVSNDQAGTAAVNYGFSFVTATTATIKTITVTVSGSGLGGAPEVVLSYGVGTGTVAISGAVITYNLTAAASIPAGTRILLQLSGLTNPAGGDHTAAIVTRAADGASIDSGTTPAMTFVARNTAKSIMVAQSLSFTIAATPSTLTTDPSVPGAVYRVQTTTMTVLTNANSGYTLTVSGNDATGVAVTGNGPDDAGFSVSAAFAAGTRFASERRGGMVVAQSTTATGATANLIAITERTTIDPATPAGPPLGALNYILTANYN